MATLVERYVDPDATGTGTGLSWANAWTSLSAAEANNRDCVTNDEQWTIYCRSSAGTADTTAVNWNGWTTDATRYVEIAGDFSGTAWDATKYRLQVTDSTVLILTNPYIRVRGIQIATVSPTASGRHGIQISGTGIQISKVMVKGHASGTHNQRGIYPNTTGDVKIWNSIIYNFAGISSSGPIYMTGGGTITVYSSSWFGGETGFWNASGTAVAKNCYGGGSSYGTSDYYGTITKTTCASSDTSGTAGLQSIAVNTTNFTNVTSGSENYALPLGSALVDVGTNTSGDAAPLNFTDDINGAARGATWDIGADEYVAAGGGVLSYKLDAWLKDSFVVETP
jgi:hypothetical protein